MDLVSDIQFLFRVSCLHNCKGCHNPQTHDSQGGYIESVSNIIKDIESRPRGAISGITISGGDPLEPYNNIHRVKELLIELKKREYNIWLYTGYKYEQLKYLDILKYIDVIVDGEFHIDKKSPFIAFRGSKNQRIIDVQESLKQNKVIDISGVYDERI